MNTLGLHDLKPVRLQDPVTDDAMDWLAYVTKTGHPSDICGEHKTR